MSRHRIAALTLATLAACWFAEIGAQQPADQPDTDAPLANVLVNNPAADASAQDTQSGTTLVRLANGTLVAAFNDSGSFVNGSGTVRFTGFARSTNGGTTWTDQGTLPLSTGGDAGYPSLTSSVTTGTVLLSTVKGDSGSAIQVFRSTDSGETFAPAVNGMPGFGASDNLDKPWITVDNFPGIGQGTVYLVARNFGGAGGRPSGIYMTRSVDDGLTFLPSGGVPLPALGTGEYVIVGPDHAVYVFYLLGQSIRLRKSTDGGLTFGAEITATSLTSTAVNGDLGLNGGFRSNSFPYAAVNPGNGHLYLVYNDPAQVSGGDRGNILFRQSIDGGGTWSAPITINTVTTNDQFFPTISVTPDGSRVFVSWYDRRLSPDNTLIDYFGRIGAASGGGVAWQPDFRITTESFPVARAQDQIVQATYMGDYDQSAADNTNFYVTWGDNRLGNSFHARQPDVRFARIPAGGPGTVLGVSTSSGGNGNGAIEPSECNDLTVPLLNLSSSPATGVSAVLTTSTPQVVVTQGSSTYPNIPPGGTAVNNVPYKISTGAAFVCGTNIDFVLTVTTASENYSVSFRHVNPAPLGLASQFDNNTPMALPDLTTVESTIDVAGVTAPIGDVRVSLHLTHTFAADLDISLVGPDGTTIDLSSDNGGGGDNYGTSCSPQSARTTFSDAGGSPITVGIAPFAGTFRPEQPLSAFLGKSGSAVNGAWRLRIADDLGSDTGQLLCWSLIVVPSACTAGGGGCAVPPNDFDQDNDPDLLWQHPNGQAVLWRMNGTTFTGDSSYLSAQPLEWHLRGSADFTSDGKPDLIWQHPQGMAVIWVMNGTSYTGDARYLYSVPTEWRLLGAADFTSDGKPDLIWQHPSGAAVIWVMNGTTYSGDARYLYSGSTEWKLIGAGDFTADGRPDLIWQHPTGAAVIWVMNGTTYSGDARYLYSGSTEWILKGSADYSLDGKLDLLWQHPLGMAVIWVMNGTTYGGDARYLYSGPTEWKVVPR